ncbi:MAG: hypothetical protein LBD48_12505 [Treponema sp.]|nr:hypothetical protein [Treponema sp.]
MKRYCVKCPADRIEYIEILTETDEGYFIRLTRQGGGSEKITEEHMPRHLFNLCLKTGYLYEQTAETVSVA